MRYIKLMRVKHYLKNMLIALPLFFNKSIFNPEKLCTVALGIICFSLISSTVYILNDIMDVEKDRLHPKKKERPIASGQVSVKHAVILMGICWVIVTGISLALHSLTSFLLLILYFGLNVAYSFGLKNYPIIDVAILASGFVIRVLYGGLLTGIEISKWLYIVIVAGSLFMGLGKRRNELRQHKNTRVVLRFYNEAFLDKNMYVCLSLIIVFYALWSIELTNPVVVWTVPFLMIILMKYSYDIEGASDGDPVEVLLKDKILIALTSLYALLIFVIIYFV